jgi:preprotein translocase subunit SecF
MALAYLVFFYMKTGDIMHKDVALSGGTAITVYSDRGIEEVRKAFPDATVRKLSDFQTGKQLAFSLETSKKPEEITPSLEAFLGYNLTEKNSSVEFTGSSLSESFYKELRMALILAFLLMAIVVFVIFRSFIPSLAVIQAGFTDIIVPLAFVDLIGFRISSAGIAAFLMLIGYSVDTDILLTTKVLRRSGMPLNERFKSALKTGLTMTTTSLVAVFLAFLIVRNISPVLSEIFLILSVGLVVDMISTWCGNTGILKWYCIKKGIK